jgi:hypothetical protein
MSRIILGTALVGAFLAGGLVLHPLSSRAQDKDEPKVRGFLYPNWKKLGLSEDQTQAIYKVQAKYRSQIDKLEAQIKRMKAEERVEAEKLLTPAQRQRLKEILSGDTDKDRVTKPADKTTKPADKPAADKTPDKK